MTMDTRGKNIFSVHVAFYLYKVLILTNSHTISTIIMSYNFFNTFVKHTFITNRAFMNMAN